VALLLIFGFTTFVNPQFLSAATQEELQKELAEIERQIADQEADLKNIQGEKQTLTNKLGQLKKEQTTLKLQIQANDLKVKQLGGEIDETQESITQTSDRLDKLKINLAEVVRQVADAEERSLVEMIILNDSLSEALAEVENFNRLSDGLLTIAGEMRALKNDLTFKQDKLEEQQSATSNLISIQILQAGQYSSKVQEQDSLLEQTKGLEAEYQGILNQTRQKASQVRARLYELAGGTTTNVTFGEAMEIAKWVSDQTGVRAALLLAVLTQESNLGKNVGTCNRAGDPPEKSWSQIMHPTRDAPIFPGITEELGLDTETTPVSCPMRDSRGNRVGWGGAMGPAQFIPSTWRGYKDKVTAITGRPANPWDIRDAFIAAGVLLRANGATVDGEDGEWRAAMRYFSGSTNPRFRFYGDNVLSLARRYQAEIDGLN